MMKLSKREKILLGILGIMVLLVGYYKFIFTPQRNKIEVYKEQKASFEEKLNNLKLLVESMPQKESDVKVISTKIKDKTSKLYPDIVQEKIIRELDKLMTDSSIYGSISFSDISMEPVAIEEKTVKEFQGSKLQEFKNQFDNIGKAVEYIESNKNENKVNDTDKDSQETKVKNEDEQQDKKTETQPKENTIPVKQIKASLNFKGSYNNVVGFIKNIENFSKYITVVSINLSQSSENEISGACSLEFYAVPKITDEDKDYFNWDLNNPYGKENIFDGSLNINPPKTVENIASGEKPKYEFVMSVKPQNSDFPTIILGRANDKDRKSYVYADSNKIENIEVTLEKENDKYYYRYKTSRDSFPINYKAEKAEFSPDSQDIYFNILSSLRLSPEDNSGANIKLVNKTDKKVVVVVEGDDGTSPRVKIEGEGGNIEIKKGP